MANDIKVQLMTPLFRMSFPKLVTAVRFKRDGKETGEPKFGMNMVLNPEDLKKFKRADSTGDNVEDVNISEICKELVGQKWPQLSLPEAFPKLPNGTTNWPIKKGDALIDANAKLPKPKKMEYLKGMFQISCTASDKYAPRLSYREAGHTVKLDRDSPDDLAKIKKLFSGGNYAIAEVSVCPVEVSGKCFVAFYMNGVQWRKNGEPFGGQSMLDKFDGIDGGESDFDPTAEDFNA